MSTNSEHQEKKEQSAPEKQDGSLQLILSMADTTWRMFTPPAILVPAGIYADLKWGTKPWMTALSAVAGLTISVLLIKRQLEKSE
jgi:hypothetical protein